MSVRWRLAATCLPLVLLVAFATPARADTFERVLNGGVDTAQAPWWSSANTPLRVDAGRLCADVPGGTVNPWNAMLGQNGIPLETGQPYTLRFTASASRDVTIRAVVQLADEPYTGTLDQQAALSTAPRTFVFTGTSTVPTLQGQVAFHGGGAVDPFTFCVDDVSLTGGALRPGAARDVGSPVRVNQVGYEAAGPKRASIVDPAPQPQPWQLRDQAGAVVASGLTEVRGTDEMSRDHVHIADFSAVRTVAAGYTLAVGANVSVPFDIAESPYDGLRRDALAYFLHNRSGIAIDAQYVGAAYARPAGHLGVAPNRGDTAVACLPGTCDYSLDVRGGWYDAGDHGKYVVNGALAAWQLMDAYERSLHTIDHEGLQDGLLRVPEGRGGVPDILDEARWEMEFLLRMQVPAGKPLAGTVHHKVHDLAWTPQPTLPHEDPQPRFLHPPSTAATLNLAATGAQCARIWAVWDKAFAARCLAAAETAWQAATAHPHLEASRDDDVGGGPYDDVDTGDEHSWAAAELFATTRKPEYLPAVTATVTHDVFDWKKTGALSDLTIVRVPYDFPLDRVLAAQQRVLTVADGFVRNIADQGYPNPFRPPDGAYPWGSNGVTANAAMIMGVAHDISHDPRYRDGVLESLDHLLGRNALNQSFVSGYGERASHNQHHRHWAHQLDPELPNPPPGALAGGPNSGLQDPVAQQNLRGCAPATCYIDDIGSYSTNEVAINWNSALAWITAFADAP